MWTYKKSKRLLNSLQSERSRQLSTSYQYRFLSSYRRYPKTNKKMVKWTNPQSASYMRKRTMEQELRAIKRRVSRNTPAPSYFRSTNVVNTTAASGFQLAQINVTSLLTGDSSYHDLVTGDKFINQSLTLRVLWDKGVNFSRVMVYAPKKAGNTFVPSVAPSGIVQAPDSNSFWIIHDHVYTQTDPDQTMRMQRKMGLNGMLTTFNTDNSLIEKGEVILLFLFQHDVGISQPLINYSLDHQIVDK